MNKSTGLDKILERLEINRRKALAKIGVGTAAIGGVPLISASSTKEFKDGHSLNCYFSPDSDFDMIYNDVKGWENSKVWLSHDKWAENIILRVGSVGRVSNSTVHWYWDNENDKENDPLMVAGDWAYGNDNVYNHIDDKGRINDQHCYQDKDVAYKFWFHEVGHAHGLQHRNEWGGQLMDSGDLDAMHLNSSECTTWRNNYSASTSTQSDDGSNHHGDHDHGGRVICSPPPRNRDNDEGDVESRTVTRVTVEKQVDL